MNFLTGITNLTNWTGNVIMPTLAALFFALGVLRYAHGQAHTYTPWAGFLCLMVSESCAGSRRSRPKPHGTTRTWSGSRFEWVELDVQRFSSRVRGAATVARFMLYSGVGHRIYAGGAPDAAFQRRGITPSLSGLLRLAEWFIAQDWWH